MKLKFELQISKDELEILQGKSLEEAESKGYQKATEELNRKLKAFYDTTNDFINSLKEDEENSEFQHTPVNTTHVDNQQEMEDTHEEVVLSTPIEEHHIDAAANAFGVTKDRVREILEYYKVTTFEEFLNHPDIPVEYKNYVNEYL